MTETLIVKYSFILYSFKFLTLSLPKFRDIKNNIIQHYWWMWFPRKLWMYSMILKVKFAYVVVFVYACLFTSWHQNTFLTNESSAAPSLFSASCPFGKTVRSAKCPFGKMSVLQNVRRQNVHSAKCLLAKCLSAKCLGTKVTFTVVQFWRPCIYWNTASG